MQERMANRRVYETSGRAYVLSGLSSHSSQRATARGDSTDSTSLVRAYQTPSMADMVNLSQTMSFGNPSPRPAIRPTQSFPARPRPRGVFNSNVHEWEYGNVEMFFVRMMRKSDRGFPVLSPMDSVWRDDECSLFDR
ncbi:UNVERIFIED_CONTAM: hypothetical protein Sradi_0399100 [Sesamum radiatum]|uniref:VWA-Hint protein Vwaint domain-containing protein n=1 Tax=Sesamum radiatum TaxID=300843 RepID=A0AAW2W5R2_SESRA